MKRNSKNLETEYTIEQLEYSIDKYQRDDVIAMLKAGILSDLEEEKRIYFYCRLCGLRSMDILDFLSRQNDYFPVKMLQLDFDISQNKLFALEAMEKYQNKFNTSDEEECRQLFEIACIVGSVKIIRVLIRQKKAADCYAMMGSAAPEIFELILTIPENALTDDQWVEMYLNAFTAKEGRERIDYLLKHKKNLFLTNSEGKTAVDLLEERTKSFRYGNRKSDRYQKIEEERLAVYLKKVQTQKEEKAKKGTSKNSPGAIICICILACLVLAAMVYNVTKGTGSSSAESTTAEEATTVEADNTADEESDDTAYSTDASLTIADGDTVNIDYTGYIDDVAFDGGSTNGSGTDLTIGSGSYIDDFEEQLIDYHPGDTVDVTVTFPEDYGNEELNGQEAVFEVTINGIYE
ncbi:MAG: FKBP-type peptidyl-prolyl cis-trans isomerase [Clostridiales bacterium]|nr:FKBP-type peptidyl-prolyl cis-trans isomerase [Clostridiales bacterium]